MHQARGGRPPLDDAEYERCRRTADSNSRAARREAEAGAHHIACMLAEQAAQCALKGLLHGLGRTSEAFGHGLVRLADRIAAAVESTLEPGLRAGLQRLAQSYLPSRYPDALPEGSPLELYGPEHSAQALADAEAALSFAQGVWQRIVAAHEESATEGVDE